MCVDYVNVDCFANVNESENNADLFTRSDHLVIFISTKSTTYNIYCNNLQSLTINYNYCYCCGVIRRL